MIKMHRACTSFAVNSPYYPNTRLGEMGAGRPESLKPGPCTRTHVCAPVDRMSVLFFAALLDYQIHVCIYIYMVQPRHEVSSMRFILLRNEMGYI